MDSISLYFDETVLEIVILWRTIHDKSEAYEDMLDHTSNYEPKLRDCIYGMNAGQLMTHLELEGANKPTWSLLLRQQGSNKWRKMCICSPGTPLQDEEQAQRVLALPLSLRTHQVRPPWRTCAKSGSQEKTRLQRWRDGARLIYKVCLVTKLSRLRKRVQQFFSDEISLRRKHYQFSPPKLQGTRKANQEISKDLHESTAYLLLGRRASQDSDPHNK